MHLHEYWLYPLLLAAALVISWFGARCWQRREDKRSEATGGSTK